MSKSKYPWIKASDTGNDAPLESFRGTEAYVLAYFTDAFKAGRADRMLAKVDADMDKLLELRVFTEKQELWLHRSVLGAPFSWRLAAEENIPPAERERYCFETRQLLDLGESPDEKPKYDSDGLRILQTEAGRSFKLPIAAAERYVRIMNYVCYDDDDGVANAADYRLIGFAKEGK